MKLQITRCRDIQCSAKATLAHNFVIEEKEKHSVHDVAAFFATNYKDDFFEVEDLSNWTAILERLDEILTDFLTKLPTVDNLQYPAEYSVEILRSTCSILKFLCLLLRSAKDKRFFLSLQTVHQLMRAADLDVALLATELFFFVCIPSSSMSNAFSDDLADHVEVPDDVANDAQVLFESLSLMSPEFGVVEYLNGHAPTFLTDALISSTASTNGNKEGVYSKAVGVRLPARKGRDYAVNVVLPLETLRGADELSDAAAELTMLSQWRDEHSLSSSECWTLLNYRRVLQGLSEDCQYRTRIAIFRMHTFFLLVHSKLPSEPIEDYFKFGSPFMQDLLEVADGNSEVASSLTIARPLHLSYTALEILLALLENKLHRRTSFANPANILQSLALARNLNGAENTNGGQDDAWMAIVLSACSVVPALYGRQSHSLRRQEQHTVTSSNSATAGAEGKEPEDDSIAASTVLAPMSLTEMNDFGRYIRLGLELYALSISSRDATNVMADMSLISTIIGLIHSSLPLLTDIIDRQHTQRDQYVLNPYDTHVQLVVTKALYCLELTIERPGYLAAFRESDGPPALSRVLQVFAAVGSAATDAEAADSANAGFETVSPLTLDACARSLLESALALQFLSTTKSRQAVIMQGAGGAETTLRLVYEPFFGTLCNKIFSGPFYKNEVCWGQAIAILKEVIDIDPPFLSHFLHSSYSVSLKRALEFPANGSFPELFTVGRACELDSILTPLMRLAFAICITADGKAYLSSSNIIRFVVEATIQPSVLLPTSLGMHSDRLYKIGKLLVHVMLDFDAVRNSTKNLLREKILSLAQEARHLSTVRDLKESPDWDSPRMLCLQKLANVCMIVESMLSEHRHHHGDTVRDVLTEPVVEALIGAYSCTLPSGKQLFAQLSLRHHSTFPHYGHVSSAKAITSLLKTATSRAPQNSFVFPILCREIDERLSVVSGSKQALRAMQSTAAASAAENQQKNMSRSSSMDELFKLSGNMQSEFESAAFAAAQDGGPIPGMALKSRRRTRTSSKGNSQSSNVMVLGVLDAFPNRAIIDPALKSEVAAYESDFEEQAWRYLTSTLLIEWLSMILSNVLRMDHRSPQSRMISASKDTLRRLFAFHRSSLMEVTRYSAQRWQAKPIDDCRFKKSMFEPFASADGEDLNADADSNSVPRTPSVYQLRVSSTSGALVREGVEIEDSRIVFTAECGSSIIAYERAINAAGILRYRTAHGWISEFRRDQLRSPIVELLDIPEITDEEVTAQLQLQQLDAADNVGKITAENSPTAAAAKKARTIMTMKEAACACMTRSHTTLRQVAVYLSRTILSQEAVAQQSLSRSTTSLSPSASMVSVALGKIIKGFFSNSISCLDESSLPESFIALRNKYLPGERSFGYNAAATSKATANSAADESGSRKGYSFSSPMSSASASTSTPNSASGKQKPPTARKNKAAAASSSALPMSDSAEGDAINTPTDPASSGEQEAIKVDAASLALYYMSMVKTLLLPVLEDKNGNLNILLLRTIANQGVISSLADALVFIILVMKSCIDDLDESTTPPTLSSTGRCALYALPSMLALFRKLMNRDIFIKSISMSNPSSGYLLDEIGPYQIHELIFHLLSTVCDRIIPLMRDNVLSKFPADVQYEWLGLVGEVVQNLVIPLPQPKELPSKYTTHSSSHSSRVLASQPSASQNMSNFSSERHSMLSRLSAASAAMSSAGAVGTPAASLSSISNRMSALRAEQRLGPGARSPTSAAAVNAAAAVESRFNPDMALVATLAAMGFSERNVVAAMHFIRSNNVDEVTDALLSNPASVFPSPPRLGEPAVAASTPPLATAQPEESIAAEATSASVSTTAAAAPIAAATAEMEPPSVTIDAEIGASFEDANEANNDEDDGDDDDLASALAMSMQSLSVQQSNVAAAADVATNVEAAPPPVPEAATAAANELALPLPPPVLSARNPSLRRAEDALPDLVHDLEGILAVGADRTDTAAAAASREGIAAVAAAGVRQYRSDPPSPATGAATTAASGASSPGAAASTRSSPMTIEDVRRMRNVFTFGSSPGHQYGSIDAAAPRETRYGSRYGEASISSTTPAQGPGSAREGKVSPNTSSGFPSSIHHEFQLHTQRFSIYTEQICSCIVPSVMDLCAWYGSICGWEKEERLSLLSFAIELIVKLNVTTKSFDITKILKDMTAVIEEDATRKQQEHWYGSFYFLAIFLRDGSVRKEVLQSPSSRDTLLLLTDRTMHHMQLLQREHLWPQWITPAMVLLHELMNFPNIPNPMKLQQQAASGDADRSYKTVTSSSNNSSPRSLLRSSFKAEEKEENGAPSESKVDFDLSNTKYSSADEAAREAAAADILLDNLFLLPSLQWEEVFDLVMKIIALCVDTTTPPPNKSLQGLLVLIHSALGRPKLTELFVQMGGVTQLLQLCFSALRNFSASIADSAEAAVQRASIFSAVTLIIRRCMETGSELQYSIHCAVLRLFKDLPTDEKSLPLDKFLQVFSPHLMRSPDDFWKACSKSVKFIKKGAANSSSVDPSDGSAVDDSAVRVVPLNASEDTNNMDDTYAAEPNVTSVSTLRAIMCHILDIYRTVKSGSSKTSSGNDVNDISSNSNGDSSDSSAAASAFTDDQMASVDVALNALSDAVLSMRRVPALIASLMKSDIGSAGLKPEENFLDFIIAAALSSAADADATAASQLATSSTDYSKTRIWATSRFLIALCAFRGPSRNMALHALLKVLKVNAVAEAVPKTGAIADWKGKEAHRITVIARVTGLLSMMIRASKSPQQRENANGQGVSVDTIIYLIEHGHILKQLTQALISIPPCYVDGEKAVAAILELMELVTRPKLQAHLDKIQKAKAAASALAVANGSSSDGKSAVNHSAVTNAGDHHYALGDTAGGDQLRGDIMLDMTQEDMLSSNSNQQLEPRSRQLTARGSELGRLIEHMEDEEEEEEDEEEDEEGEEDDDDDDGMEEDDDEEDHGDDEDSDDDEDDEDNDEDDADEDDDDEGDFDDEDDDDDDMIDAQGAAIPDDAYLNVGAIISPSAGEVRYSSMQGGARGLTAASFVTPPEAIPPEIQLLLDGLDPDGAPLEASASILTDLIRRIHRPGTANPVLPSLPEQIMLAPAAALPNNQELLPQGVATALEVQTPLLTHPLLSRGLLRPSAAALNRGGYGSQLGAMDFPSVFGARPVPEQMQYTGVPASQFQHNRTVMHFTQNSLPSGTIPRSWVRDQSAMLFNDAPGFEEIDALDPFPAPAVWPSSRPYGFPASNTVEYMASRGLGAGIVSASDSSVLADAPAAYADLTRIARRQLEQSEISGLRIHDESSAAAETSSSPSEVRVSSNPSANAAAAASATAASTVGGDERSQSSYSFTTRGDGEEGGRTTEGGFSYTQETNQAQPQPHHNRVVNEEENSRTGDSIPPLIEIDNPDAESNEDMSVITLPQEDPNQPDSRYGDHDDNMSINTHNSLAPHDFLRGIHGFTSSDQLDQSGSVSQFSMSPIHIALGRLGGRSASSAASRSNASINSDADYSNSVQETSAAVSGIAITSGDSLAPAAAVSGNAVSPETIESALELAPSSDNSTASFAPVTNNALVYMPSYDISTALSPVDELVAIEHFDTMAQERSRESAAAPTSAISTASAVVDAVEAVNTSSESEAVDESRVAATTANTTTETSSEMATATVDQDIPRSDNAMIVTDEAVVTAALAATTAAATTTEVNATGGPACPAGYDSEVFFSLPLDMQLEIVQQHGETTDQTRQLLQAAGMDYETFSSLPESIQQEVLDQARREQQQNNSSSGGDGGGGINSTTGAAGNAQEMDNASFVASLAPELRNEVLLTADAQLLSTLPPELVAEAQMVRERAANNWQQRELVGNARAMAEAAAGNTGDRMTFASQLLSGNVRIGGGVAAGAGGGDDDEDDEDDDDEDEYYPTGGPYRQRREIARVGGEAGRNSSSRSEKPKDGVMRVPIAQKWKMKMPHNFIVAIAKVLLYSKKSQVHGNKSDNLLFRILQNISINFKTRDANLQLLISLLAGHKELLRSAMRQITGSDCDHSALLLKEASQLDSESLPRAAFVSPQSNSSSSINSSNNSSSSSNGGDQLIVKDLEVSSVAKQRVFHILTQLASVNTAFKYLTLIPRRGNFTAVEDDVDSLVAAAAKPHTTAAVTALENASDAVKASSAEGVEGKGPATATAATTAAAGASTAAGSSDVSVESNTKIGVDTGTAPATITAAVDNESVEIVKQRMMNLSGLKSYSNWNSLLEVVISLSTQSDVANFATSLDTFSALLDILTAPLDSLPNDAHSPSAATVAAADHHTTASATVVSVAGAGNSGSTNNSSSSSSSSSDPMDWSVANDVKVRDEKNGMVSLPIPRVALSKEVLGYLCDVLLSDQCSKRIFTNITLTISRLSKVSSNNSSLLQLLSDVIGDLAMQSQGKLEQLTSNLRSVKSKYLSIMSDTATTTATATAAGLKSAEDTNTTDANNSNNYNSSNNYNNNSSSSSNSRQLLSLRRDEHSSELPCSILPMSEAGGRQHDRLLRVVQTLQSMAEKTGRLLQDVSPTDDLFSLWSELNDSLCELRSYLADKDDEDSSTAATAATAAAAASDTIRPQTTLSAVLSRLLPVIEAFFLVHTSDFLSERTVEKLTNFYEQRKKAAAAAAHEKAAAAGEEKETTATTTVAAAATVAAVAAGSSSNGSGGGEKSDSTAAAASVAVKELQQQGELISPESMPGHSYRTSPAYIRNNLSLYAESILSASNSSGDGVDAATGRALSRVLSLRKQSSFPTAAAITRSYSNGSISNSGVASSNKNQRLLAFVQSHKGLLNLLVKSKPALLEDSLKAFVRITQLRGFLKFDNKRRYFFTQLKRLNQQQSSSRRGLHLQIRRSQVFEDSFHQLRVRNPEELRGRLQVNFYGEEGVDAGGLTREWYTILAREIFNPNYVLFTAAVDGATFQPNPLSMINTNHLEYFRFVGRVIGKAICDGQLMDAHFTRSFYKHLLGMPVDFSDIQATEPDYHKTLKQILDTALDALMIELSFSAEIQKFGRTEIVDLVPNGRNIAVTDENKHDYVRLIAHHRMTAAIRAQIDAFLVGFYDLVPPELVSIFSPAELELLICGLPDVNVEELQQNTDYHQYKASDEAIVWFWDALKSFNREERASFLQFVTGTSKVPLGGFANLQGMRGSQRFSIHKAYGDTGLLPSAHTCFNQLDLPLYRSKEELTEKLRMAISEGAEGFGFA